MTTQRGQGPAATLPAAPPRHAHGVTLTASDSRAHLVDRDGTRVALDDVALALWELCDGETTVDEIVEATCELFTGDRTVIVRDVRGTIAALAAKGLLVFGAETERS